MPAREFEEWKLYFGEEPFTDFRQNYGIALLASTIFSSFTGKKSKITDFMPFYDERRVKKEPKQNKQSTTQLLHYLLTGSYKTTDKKTRRTRKKT